MANTHDFVVKNGLQVNDDSTVAGDISLGDNNKLKFGASADLQIYHSGTWSLIDDTGTGGLSLRSNDIRLEKYTGETLARFAADNAVFLYYDNSLKFQTTTTGIDVTGTAEIDTLSIGGTTVSATPTELNLLDGATVTTTEINYNDITTLGTVQTSKTVTANSSGNVNFPDGYKAQFGDGSDLQIYHNTSHSVIKDAGTGNLNLLADNLRMANAAWDKWYFTADNGGAATIFWNGAGRLATSSAGIDVTGNITVSGTVDGRDLATDGTKLDGIESGATADQTITAGSGLTGGGTGDVTLYHADTSSQASVDNSNGTVIQDVTLDGYGHVTALGSVDLDGRYYTETEADARYLRKNTSDVHTFNTTTGEALKFANNTSGGQIQIGFQQNDTDGMHHRGYIRSRKSSAGNAAGIIEILPRQSGGGTGTAFTLEAGQDPKWGGNKVWHAGNDGSGSGLDADTVDGIQAASFLRSDTSDTMTGDLTLSTGQVRVGTGGRTRFQAAGIYDDSTNGNSVGIFFGGGQYIGPLNGSGNAVDATIDIGSSSYRFEHLYLSGTAYSQKIQFAQSASHLSDNIDLWGGNNAHLIGTESYYNRYGPDGWGTGSNVVGHKFYARTGQLIAQLGTGGSTGNLNSSFYGDVTISGSLTTEGPDGGAFIGTWPGNSNFAMFGTANMTGSEYALISDGTNTYISAGTGGSATMRGGVNDSDPQIEVTNSDIQIRRVTTTGPDNLYLRFIDTSTEHGVIGTSYNDDLFIASTGKMGMRFGSDAVGFGNDTGTIVNNAYDLGYNSYRIRRGYFGTDVRAPIFYDIDNTSYYVDPASNSTILDLRMHSSSNGANGTRAITLQDGTVLFRSTTDYYHKMWYYDGLAFSTNSGHGHFRFYADSNTLRNATTGGATLVFDIDSQNITTTAYGSMRSPIYYDNDNTAYYTNPASNSNFYTIQERDGGEGYIEGGSGGTYYYHRWGVTIGSTASSYKSIAINGGKYKYFELEANVRGSGGANHQGFFWGNAVNNESYGGNTTGYKTTHQNSTNFHIRSTNGNSNQNTINPGFDPNDGAWHHQKITCTPDGYTRVYLDGNLVIETTGRIPSSPGYVGFINYAGTAQYNNIKFRALTDDYVDSVASHRSTVDMRAPLFYDSNNTSYYVNPNSTSSMWNVNIRGDADSTNTSNQIFFWGNGSTTTSAIGFKANGGNFTNPTGNGDGYNTYLTMDTAGRGWVFRRGTGGTNFSAAYTSGWILNNGLWQSNGSMRAPIFYDSNDTSHYINPSDGGFNITAGTNQRVALFTNDSGLRVDNAEGNGQTDLRLGAAWTHVGIYAPGEIHVMSSASIGFIVSNSQIGTIDGSGNLTMSGNVTAYSDERLKEDIKVIPNALEKVKAIRGVTFKRKDQPENTDRETGVIAQEVQKVLPEVVKNSPEDDNLTVAYGNMVGLLIEAIKELKDEVDDLKAQLAAK